jgi:hypothetical protein
VLLAQVLLEQAVQLVLPDLKGETGKPLQLAIKEQLVLEVQEQQVLQVKQVLMELTEQQV